MKKEFTAKTLDEAKAMAAAEFGVAAEEIDFDILEQPRKGLFGMKGVARVMASYEAPEAPVASTRPQFLRFLKLPSIPSQRRRPMQRSRHRLPLRTRAKRTYRSFPRISISRAAQRCRQRRST